MADTRDNIIVEKSDKFADRITNMYRYLSEKRLGDKDMLKQIVRSGTSVGANISEGQFAQSKADFLTKMTIALKEANETRFWLKRLHGYGSLSDKEFESIIKDSEEIISILTVITKTTKENLKKEKENKDDDNKK